jgi:hypothetical protein
MICTVCGEELRVGDWPYCPHGVSHVAAIGDSIPGGQVIETMDHEPVTVYSKKQLLEEADKRGLRLRDCWAGPGDRYLTNWSTITSKTLDDAKALLERVGKASTTQSVVCETAQFTVKTL